MKKDQSFRVVQRDKISQSFEIKEFNWTEKQKKFIELALDKNNQIIICKSCPGTGKTLLSIFCCLTLLNDKKISEIVFLRNPIESCSKGIGFIKGEKNDKLDVYGTPLYDHLKELIGNSVKDKLFKDERISIESLGFIKGSTWNTTGIICDESEDMTKLDLRLVLSRLGRFSKLFIIGDENQSNIKNNGFLDVFNLFNDQNSKDNGIITFEFGPDDCMRNGILKFILEKFNNIIK